MSYARPKRRGRPMEGFQQAPANAPQPVRPDMGFQLHDDADLISFRNDAYNRFVTNQEYLENIASKFIHTSKIIPPSIFPSLVKPETNEEKEDKLTKSRVDEDLKIMRARLEAVKSEHEKEKEPSPYLPNNEEYLFQKNALQTLATLQSQVYDEDSFKALESGLAKVLEDYQSKFNKKYETTSRYKMFSVKDMGIEVHEAPKNYDPRLIDSLINIGAVGEAAGKKEDEPIANSPSNFEDENMFLDFDGPEKQYESNPVSDGFALTIGNQEASPKPEAKEDVADIQHLLETEANADLPNDGIIGGDMDELINFDAAEDPIMAEGSFEQDFFNQMDHTMD